MHGAGRGHPAQDMTEPSLEALLQHSRWVRSLAASLVRDPGLADDLVQEAWLQVLRRGPRDDRSPRGWLATLLRRQLRQMRRGEERRTARERDHARERAEAPAHEAVERAELHKSLVQAVLDLREPFRTAVILRYLEERSPEEIARLTGVPVATVHSRLGRGLAALRTRLGKRGDERPGWLGLLLWARVGRREVRLRHLRQELPRLLSLAAGLVAAVLVAGGWAVRSFADERPRERAAEHGAGPALAAVPEAALVPGVGEPVNTRAPLEVAPLHRRIDAVVVDREGEPVAGVGVRLVEDTKAGEGRVFFEGTSRSDGRVTLPVPPVRALLRTHDPALETAFAAVVVPWRDASPTLVVAPRIAVAGRVLDEDGAPLVGAAVRLWIDPHLPVAQRLPLDFSGPILDLAWTDEHGAFSFASLAALQESAFTVFHSGHGRRIFAVPLESRSDLELVLARASDGPRLRGRVRDETGRPAAGALVALHPARTQTDAEGCFELLLDERPRARNLVAVLAGQAASVVELEPAAPGAEWPEWIEVELSREERFLEGLALDASGRPVPGARVWLADPTPAGAALPVERGAEAWRAATGREGWWWVESDARGAFRIPGVFAREYRVRAADPRTLAQGEVVARPGVPCELVLGEETTARALAGRVLDERGRPVVGARVALARTFWRVESGSEPVELGLELAPTLTDAEGRFALPPCAPAGTRVEVRADGTLPVARALAELDLARGLELVVSRRAHLRVELDGDLDGDLARADSIALLDADGAPRPLVLLREWCPHLYARAPLIEGRSLVLAASLEARTLVLYRGDEEVERVPIVLRAGELTVLRR